MSTSTLIHTSTGARGWDAFDRIVLWAVGARPCQTFDGIVQLLPEGIAYHLVRSALKHAIRAGLVEQHRTYSDGPVVALDSARTVYTLTRSGTTAATRAA